MKGSGHREGRVCLGNLGTGIYEWPASALEEVLETGSAAREKTVTLSAGTLREAWPVEADAWTSRR